MPNFVFLGFQFLPEGVQIPGQLLLELGGFLKVTPGFGLTDQALEKGFSFGLFGLGKGTELGESLSLGFVKFGSRAVFFQSFHGEFVGGFHLPNLGRGRRMVENSARRVAGGRISCR